MIGQKSLSEIARSQASIPKAMRNVAQWIASRIYTRTRIEGKDIYGQQFKPYTVRYAKRKGVGISEVDLYSRDDVVGVGEAGSLHMLDAIYVEEGALPTFNVSAGRFIGGSGQFMTFARALEGHKEVITISPSAPADVRYRATFHNDPRARPWFGLTDDDRKMAMDVYKRNIIKPNSTTNQTIVEVGG